MSISKSAADATRFTSTTPHASSKFPPPSSSIRSLPRRTPAPPGETPQQKVRRLIEAAARARDGKLSTSDKIIIKGRVWADRAHCFTALSLIGITGIAGIITVYSLGDMLIHNRRQRHEYLVAQRALHTAAVQEAETAVRYGAATAEQVRLVERAEGARRAEEVKRASAGPGLWARGKELLFAGLKKEDVGAELEVKVEQQRGRGLEASEGSTVLSAVEENKAKSIWEDAQREEVEHEQRGESWSESGGGGGGEVNRPGSTMTDSAFDSEARKQNGGWMRFLWRR